MASLQPRPGVDLTEDRTGEVIGAVLACAVLAGIAVAGRLASRKILKAKFSLSDYLVVLGMLGGWTFSGLSVWSAHLGTGKHIEAVLAAPENLITIQKTNYADQIIYSIALPLIKVSILLFYRGLFPGPTFALWTYVIGAFVAAWGVAILLVSIFSCKPIHGFWGVMMIPPPRCINTRAFFIGNAVPNIVTDIAILCLPIGKVWQLQLPRRSRFAVLGMFLMGGFVVVASIVRFAHLMGLDARDTTWTFTDALIWSCAEVNIAVVSASLPMMRPLLQAFLPSAFVSKMLGSQKKKTFGSNPTTSYPLPKSSGSHQTEEFQRLPENTSEAGSIPLSSSYARRSPEDLEYGYRMYDGTEEHKTFSSQQN